MAYRTPMTQSECRILLEEARPGSVVDFTEHDLSDCDFHDGDIREHLEHISDHNRDADGGEDHIVLNFTNADISGLFFDDLYLVGCIFTSAIAEHTVFEKSDLSDVHLDHAKLNDADFRYTLMAYTKLNGSMIRGANFTGADFATAYGLGFNQVDDTKLAVERLSVAHSIAQATLPAHLEVVRDEVEAAVKG